MYTYFLIEYLDTVDIYTLTVLDTSERINMESRVIGWIVIVLIIGIVVGYSVHIALSKPLTTTITETVTSYATLTTSVEKPMTITSTTVVTVTSQVTVVTSTTTTVPVVTTKTITITPHRVTVVDALGRIVELHEVPKRVVSLAPSITEILWALGLGSYVVGVDEYSNYPQEVVELVNEGKIITVGGYWNPDIEKIVMLKPDLVLADAGVQLQVRLLDKFNELGLKVVYLKADATRNIYDIYSDIRLIATIFGVEDHADELIKSIEEKIDYVKSRLMKANATSVKVLVLLGPPSWGLWTTGSGTFLDYVITSAGGINVASKYNGWVQLSYEDILMADPDAIVVTVMGLDPKKVLAEIASTPLNKTKAFKTGNVYVFTDEADDLLTRPGPRVSDAILLMAKVLHPDIFGEASREDVVKLGSQKSMAEIHTLHMVNEAVGVDVEA